MCEFARLVLQIALLMDEFALTPLKLRKFDCFGQVGCQQPFALTLQTAQGLLNGRLSLLQLFR